MEKTIFVENLEATLSLGKKLGELLQPGMLITLDGDLGAGKTTFTKGIDQRVTVEREWCLGECYRFGHRREYGNRNGYASSFA